MVWKVLVLFSVKGTGLVLTLIVLARQGGNRVCPYFRHTSSVAVASVS